MICSTTSKNGLDTSACEFGGKKFAAQSRHGSEFALCRQLVEFGCPDGALIVTRLQAPDDLVGVDVLGFGVKVQQDPMAQDRGGQRRHILVRDVIPAPRKRADLGSEHDELGRADACAEADVLPDEIGRAIATWMSNLRK